MSCLGAEELRADVNIVLREFSCTQTKPYHGRNKGTCGAKKGQ